MFYLLGQIHPLLRTAKLPSEILNKSNQTITIEIRKPIQVKTLNSFTGITSLSYYLRAKTYSINEPLKIEDFFDSRHINNEKSKQKIVDPIDPEFNNCLDSLMLVNIADIPFELLNNLAKELEESKVRERFKSICLS
jgi:hypothetical protein